jgi:hypothetical protein
MHRCIHPGSNQIPQRFVRGVWNPDRRQVAGSVEDRQLLRIAPVSLDPLAGLVWNHRRRGHDTLVSQGCELAVYPIPTTARFIAEIKLAMPSKLLRHLGHGLRRVRNHTDEPHWPTSPIFCNANGYGRFMNVHADE